MAKYLFQGSFTSEGLEALIAEGAVERDKHLRDVIEEVGGKVEAHYYAFGGTDVYTIVDLPDNTVAAALAMKVSTSGQGATTTTVLLTPAELEIAGRIESSYRSLGD